MKPLEGMRIVVTRAAHQAQELAQPLREHGAEVILLPVIAIVPPEDPKPLRLAAQSDSYDWIVFTSANAAAVYAEELRRCGRRCKARVAAVGSATRDAAESRGFQVDLLPARYVAESLAEAFQSENLQGTRVLIPSATVTRDAVAPALRSLGAHVDVVAAYRNVTPPEAAAIARTVFQSPYPDWVTLASSSAVTNLVRLAGVDSLRQSKLASIGPVASDTVRSYGLQVAAEPALHTVEGLVDAIVEQSAQD